MFLSEEFGVYEPENFAYLIKGNCLNVDGMDDIEEYGLVRVCYLLIKGIIFTLI